MRHMIWLTPESELCDEDPAKPIGTSCMTADCLTTRMKSATLNESLCGCTLHVQLTERRVLCKMKKRKVPMGPRPCSFDPCVFVSVPCIAVFIIESNVVVDSKKKKTGTVRLSCAIESMKTSMSNHTGGRPSHPL